MLHEQTGRPADADQCPIRVAQGEFVHSPALVLSPLTPFQDFSRKFLCERVDLLCVQIQRGSIALRFQGHADFRQMQ